MSTEPTEPFPDAEPSPETAPSPDAVPEREADQTLPIVDDSRSSVHAPPLASASLPRTRWAAIVWGACFATIAWSGLWMLSSADRRSDVSDWFASLNPATITAFALLLVGVLVLVTGLVGLIRRTQRNRVDRA